MFKKLLCVLLVGYLLLIQTGISRSVATVETQGNLKEFLQEFDEVTVKYEYPSLKIAAANPYGTVLPAGTPVVLRVMDTISSESLVTGSNVSFQIMQDVIVNDKVLIKSGAIANAQVSFAKRKNFAGNAGEITISDFSTRAVDGSFVPLTATINAQGNDKLVLSWGLGLFICPLFLLMKGDDGMIPAGTTKSVYTMADVSVKAESL
ncbi:MAG: hypothetical protein LBJ74_02535 [Heliobacteriaceae bacterium]|jgi:hypothetical protein|nr:hypothetical protein [Heliobacteriaceae bacterium]